jgi:toxin ParE1/3/4
MTGRVVKRPQAIHDLDEQAAFLQRDNVHVAIRFLEQADATCDILAAMPNMGTSYQTEDPRLVGLRFFRISGFEKHLIYYRPIERGIEVLRVLHGARDIPRVLGEDAE